MSHIRSTLSTSEDLNPFYERRRREDGKEPDAPNREMVGSLVQGRYDGVEHRLGGSRRGDDPYEQIPLPFSIRHGSVVARGA